MAHDAMGWGAGVALEWRKLFLHTGPPATWHWLRGGFVRVQCRMTRATLWKDSYLDGDLSDSTSHFERCGQAAQFNMPHFLEHAICGDVVQRLLQPFLRNPLHLQFQLNDLGNVDQCTTYSRRHLGTSSGHPRQSSALRWRNFYYWRHPRRISLVEVPPACYWRTGHLFCFRF